MAKILYLYAEVMGYTVSTLDQLVQNGAEIHVVSYDDGKLTPYLIPELSNVKFYQRSEYSYEKIITLASRINPEIVVVSGWEDKFTCVSADILSAEGYRLFVALMTNGTAIFGSTLHQLLED